MSVALTYIFNESFKTGIFPVSNKLAHVTLIHKGYSRLAVTNYRPISVLPIVSKGPVKLIQRVKIAHSFLRSVSNLFHFIILSLHMKFYTWLSKNFSKATSKNGEIGRFNL